MTLTPPADELPLARRRSPLRLKELGLVLVVVFMSVGLWAYGAAHPTRFGNPFLNADNLVQGVATPMSYYAIMAVGMTLVVVAGGIDISVASIMALAGLVTAWAMGKLHDAGAPALVVVPVSLLLPMVVGLACGLFNGLLIVGLRMHPFIVTLGTLSVFRGLCNVLPFETKTLLVPSEQLERGSVAALLKAEIAGQQVWPLAFMLVTVVIGFVYLSLTVWGRETYAVGGNERAALYSGVNVAAVKLRVYALSGLCAGFAGLVSLGRFGTVSTNTGTGYELTVVAAAVVGGASLAGGRGTALGALLGTLILALIENAINILKLDQEYKAIIVGLAIIVAVALDRLSETFRARSR